MLTTLDAWLQKALHPVARILFNDGVRAVHVTLCAGLISLAVGVLVAAFAFHRWTFALITVWIVLRVAFLAVEGLLATEFGQLSKASVCAREFSRIIAVTALFLPFAVIPKVSVLLTLLVVLLAIFSEFAGLLGPLIKASRRRDGPLNSAICLLMFAIFGAGIASGHLPTAPINILMAVMAVLLLMTIGKRVRAALAESVKPVTSAPLKAMAEE